MSSACSAPKEPARKQFAFPDLPNAVQLCAAPTRAKSMETKILKKPGKFKRPTLGLAIDTEEINKLYTFGGE